MLELAIDKNFAAPCWRKRVTGTATVAVSGAVLTCASVAGEDSMMDLYLPVVPGQRVEMEVFGRLLSGTAGFYFDLGRTNANDGTRTTPEKVEITALDWRRYRLSYTVPHKAGLGSILRIVLGTPNASVGSSQWHSPTVRTDGGLGTPLVLARGLVQVLNGVATIHANFPSHGVANVDRTDTTTVTVTLDHALPTVPENVRALVHASGAPESPQIPVAGTLTPGAAPTFLIRWTNGTAFQDISGAGNRFCFFEVTV